MPPKNIRPDVVSTEKASSHPIQPGKFYSCTVESVDAVGRVIVSIGDLDVTMGPVLPIGTTTRNKLSRHDSAICTFTDEFFKEIVVFGTGNLKKDMFAGKEKFNSLVDQLQSQINALRAEVELGSISLQTYKQAD